MSSATEMTTGSLKNVGPTVSPMRATAKMSLNCDKNNSEGEMFSPTSAAALALSTLHQHGADRNKRPEDLKGTRLFIQGEQKDEQEQEEKEPAAPKENQAPSSSPTFFVSGTPPNMAPPVPAHYPPPPPGYQYAPDPRYSHPPAASPWQPTQYHQYPSVHVSTPAAVGPSPPSSRIVQEVGPYHHPTFFLLQNARTSPPNGYSGPSPTQNSLLSLDPKDKPYARAQSQTSLVTPTPKKTKTDNKKSVSQTPGYSRKKKSLGVLAENFLNQYRQAPRGYTVIVDEAAVKLGVERRRIYDVVNILEAIQLVCKKQKNTYTWMGMEHLDAVFGRLQADAIEEYPQDAKDLLGIDTILADRTDNPKDIPKGREFKSLARLSQEFLQVFLVGHTTLSLPDASDKIQGATSMEELVKMGQGQAAQMDEKEMKAAAARGLKTKIRRLYDIANVFLSVGLLEKVDSADSSRRPNFSWCYRSSPKDIYDLHHAVKKATVTPSTSMASTPTQDADGLLTYQA